MANRYLKDFTPWPAGVPVPANAQFVFYDSGTDDDYRVNADRVEDAAGGAVAVRVITANPAPAFVFDELGTYTLNGQEGFYRFKAPAGVAYAVPTGPDDANWHQVAPPVPAGQHTVTLSEAVFLILANDNALGTLFGKRIFINQRASGGTVTLDVLGAGALATEDAYELDDNNPDAPAIPVVFSYDATSTSTAPRGAGGPGLPTRDLLDLTPALMDAVMALVFTDGDAPLADTPADSYPGQWFDAIDATGDAWHYYCGRGNYTPGAAGSGAGPRWSRTPKG